MNMKVKMSKIIKIYMAVMVLAVGYFGYATWNGITFWEDKVERNTEYKGSTRSRVGGYGAGRFYHK